MSILNKIFGQGVKDAVTSIGSVVDGLSTSDDEKLNAKAKLSEIVLNSLTKVAEIQGEVIKTEMQGSFLQRNWRPILMLLFAFIIMAKWFGFTDTGIDDKLELKLLDIIELGLGGYVIGRSVEKVSDKVTQNIDMSFLKKKDRNG